MPAVPSHLRRARPSLPSWALALFVLLLAAATTAAVGLLLRHADRARSGQVALVHLEAQTNALRGLPWYALAEYGPGDVSAEMERLDTDVLGELAELAQLDSSERRLGQAREAHLAYMASLRELLQALRSGDVERATIVDAEGVEPNFRRLVQLLGGLDRNYGAAARGTLQTTSSAQRS